RGPQLGRRALVIRTERVPRLLGELHRVTLAPELGDAARCQVRRLGDALPLTPEQSVTLDLRAEPRGARVERLEALDVATQLFMEVCPITDGQYREITLQCGLALLLLRDLARDLGELDHRALHARESPLELAHGFECQAAPVA